MKTFSQKLFIALVLWPVAIMPTLLKAAVTFSVTPSAISNTYSGTLTLQVAGLTSGDTVVVQKFLDANTNGVVDAGDLLMQQFQLGDGVASVFTNGTTSVTNFNVPCDTDGSANGTITAQLYPSLDFAQLIVGKYLFVLSSPAGHFPPQTNSFSVTNSPYAQSISGSVVNNGTNVPNAVIILFQNSGNNNLNPAGGVVANNSGGYSINAAPGSYVLSGFKSNFVANLAASPIVNLSAGVPIITNVPVTNATTSISGNVIDVNNSAIGLAGYLVTFQTTNSLLAIAFTDTNGNYTARVTPGRWKIGSNDRGLAYKGYLALQNSIKVNTSTGSVSGVTVALPKATAIFYGTVKDNSGIPLPGVIAIYSSDNNGNYETDGFTDTNGNYVAGAIGGLNNDQWQASYDYSSFTNYIFSQGAGGVTLAAGQAYRQDFTALLATNRITGNVQFNGHPVSTVSAQADATINGKNFHTSVDTDNSGNYSMNVANASWSVYLNCNYGGNDSLDSILGPGNYQCPNSQSVNIINNNGTANFTVLPVNSGQIFGYLTDVYGNGISGVSVYASDGLGDNYSTTTTGSGYYSVIVTNGNYTVSVDCGQLGARNFYCVSGNSASVSSGPVEVDFTTTPVTTPAYTFTNLHSFPAMTPSPNTLQTNSEGASPYGGLLLAGNTLYGTAQYGGTNGAGTVFAINTSLSNYTVVHTFSTVATNRFGTFTNSDGGVPESGLILSSNILYGTAIFGGTNGNGTVFVVNTNGAGFRVVHTFPAAVTNGSGVMVNNDGVNPGAGAVLFSNVLYSTTATGCTNGNGAVFALNTNGTYSVLHAFTPQNGTTNGDGANPYAGLILSGGTLYGTAANGGTGNGTIFAVNTNGTGFTVLYNFSGSNDGANPFAGLILVTNTLYGVASAGGHWGAGTLFAIDTNGTGFNVLHAFAGGDGGATPYAGLIFSNNVLYGTTVYGGTMTGGSSGDGTVFAFNLNSQNFMVLHAFTALDAATLTTNSDGANPYGSLVLSGNTLYGTTTAGGSTGNGTVFAVSIKALPSSPLISLPTHLSNSQFQMLVSGVAGQNYTVQMTTNLASTNWSSIFLTNPSSSTFLYTDPSATNKQRSYRVWVGP